MKNPLWRRFTVEWAIRMAELTARLRRVQIVAIKQGRDHKQAWTAYKASKMAGNGDRVQWRRWYKANKQHQRRLSAMRQQGHRIPMDIPNSLKREWVH